MKRRVRGNRVFGEGRAGESAPSSNEEIRVTDRRRFNLDGEADEAAREEARVEAPSLKPTYVEQLEARTLEAEQKVADVQSRFEQLRAQLQRETDETRQRLNRAATVVCRSNRYGVFRMRRFRPVHHGATGHHLGSLDSSRGNVGSPQRTHRPPFPPQRSRTAASFKAEPRFMHVVTPPARW